jgi:ribonuclease BN (tRNA processing enzyme)
MAKASWFPGCGWPTIEDKIRDLASYHTQPDQIGLVAREARARALVLTHLMPGSDPAELRAAAARQYGGPVAVGEDLMEV